MWVFNKYIPQLFIWLKSNLSYRKTDISFYHKLSHYNLAKLKLYFRMLNKSLTFNAFESSTKQVRVIGAILSSRCYALKLLHPSQFHNPNHHDKGSNHEPFNKRLFPRQSMPLSRYTLYTQQSLRLSLVPFHQIWDLRSPSSGFQVFPRYFHKTNLRWTESTGNRQHRSIKNK